MHQAQTAYARNVTPIRTDRSLEYDAFASITHRLKTHGQSAKTDFSALAQALHDNRKLWTILATSVSDSENRLPAKLRAQIFYLAEFTEQHTSKVLGGKETVDVLIDLNVSIMRGLKPAVPAS